MTLWFSLSAMGRADTCDAWSEPDWLFVSAPVSESSGLAASRTRPGVLFTHDDSGGAAALYALDLDGRYLGAHLVQGAGQVDWEDLASGPCPTDGEPCLYIGDIGDNDAVRSAITVYVVREPAAGEEARREEAWSATYPGGPRDAETLLVHPCTGDVYVVTKRQDATGAVFRLPADRRGATMELEPVAELALPDDQPITGGQWDAHGERLVLRTRDRLWLWTTSPGDPEAHWSEPPTELARLEEDQGEAVALTPDGALVTTDEGQPLMLHVLPCEAPAPATGECRFVPTGGCGCGGGPVGSAGAIALALASAARRAARRTRPANHVRTATVSPEPSDQGGAR